MVKYSTNLKQFLKSREFDVEKIFDRVLNSLWFLSQREFSFLQISRGLVNNVDVVEIRSSSSWINQIICIDNYWYSIIRFDLSPDSHSLYLSISWYIRFDLDNRRRKIQSKWREDKRAAKIMKIIVLIIPNHFFFFSNDNVVSDDDDDSH